MKKKTLSFLSCLLVATCTMAQTTVTFSFLPPVDNASTRTIKIVATSNAAIPSGSFSGGRLGFRFPIASTGKTAATYGQNYGVTGGADGNFTNVSFPTSSLNGFSDAVAGTTGITTFLLGDFAGGTTDSYLYVGLSYSNPATTTAVAANTPITIVQFDVPISWTGDNCIEFTTTSNDKLFEVLDATFDYSIIHSSTGLDNIAAVGSNGSFSSPTSGVNGRPSIEQDLLVYPNPAKEKVTLQTRAGDNLTGITLNDASGRTVRSIEGNGESTQTIDTANLNQGVYLLRVITNKGIVTRKIIKQ